MTTPTIILLVIIGIVLFEIFRFKQHVVYTKTLNTLDYINAYLEILKALSFVVTSKNETLEKDLSELASSFFKQNTYNALTIWVNSEEQIFRYRKTVQSISISSISKHQKLTSLEEHILHIIQREETNNPKTNGYRFIPFGTLNKDLLSKDEIQENLQSSMVIPLYYYGKNLGSAIFLSKLSIQPQEPQSEFLLSTAHIISILIHKFYLKTTLDYETRLKAVNVEW